jgi:predicted ATPase
LYKDAKSEVISLDIDTDDNVDSRLRFQFVSAKSNPAMGDIDHFYVDGHDLVGCEQFSTSDGEKGDSAEGSQVSMKTLASTSDIVSLRALRNVTYISADRKGPVDEVDYVNDLHDSVGSRGEFVLNVLESMNENSLERVRKALSEILSGASLDVEVKEGRIILSMDSSDAGAFFHPTNVGYGYGYLLTIVTAVLVAREYSIIIIENPEAHLHPGAQSKLMSFLCRIVKEKKIQLFMETHSDHIINAVMVSIHEEQLNVKDVRLLFFEKDENERSRVRPLKLTKQGRILYPPVGFFDQIDKDLSVIVGF